MRGTADWTRVFHQPLTCQWRRLGAGARALLGSMVLGLAAMALAASAAQAQESDLLMSKSAPATAAANSNISYSLSVTNIGPDDAAIPSFSDPLPAGLTFVSITQTGGTSFTCTDPGVGVNGTVNCSTATLPAGDTASFTLVVHIPVGATPGSFITNTATSSSPTDSSNENDSSTAVTQVAGGTSSDLSVLKNGPSNIGPDSNLPYTLTVNNLGPNPAANATLTDPLPAGLTFASLVQTSGPAFVCTTPAVGTGGTVTCSLGSFDAGASANFTLTAHVPPGTPTGTAFTNTATVSTSTDDPTPDNNSSTITTNVSAVDLAVTKTGPASVTRQQDFAYTIAVSNSGPDTAISVLLLDTLPANLTFVSLTQNTGPSSSCSAPAPGSSGTLTCSFTSLGVGASAQFTLTVNSTGNFATSRTNIATVSTSGSYDPNSSNDSATSNAAVTGTLATSTTLTSAPNPSVFGQAVTFTATVSSSSGVPTGSVTFSEGSTAFGTVALDGSGKASLTISTLAAGAHSITAAYDGTVNYATSSAGTTQTVNKVGSTTTVTSSPDPSTLGEVVKFTATVASATSGGGTPTGTVKFAVDGVDKASVALSGGVANMTTGSLTAGSHTITASYQGNDNFLASSGTRAQTVKKGATTATLTSSVNPSDFGASVTFTATISPVAPATAKPTGKVKFVDTTNSKTLATVALSSGVATLKTSSLTVGKHAITATYGGSTKYTSSTASVVQTVKDVGKLVVSPTTDMVATLMPGKGFSPSSFTYKITTTGGSVKFTITGVPVWLTASRTSGTASSTATTVKFVVNSKANSTALPANATISFNNTTNGKGTQTRTAELTGGHGKTLTGAARVTTMSPACSALGNLNVGDLMQSVYRPAADTDGDPPAITLFYGNSAMIVSAAKGTSAMHGKGAYTGSEINARARPTNGALAGAFDLAVSPAAAGSKDESVTISGTIGNFAKVEGCNVGISGVYLPAAD